MSIRKLLLSLSASAFLLSACGPADEEPADQDETTEPDTEEVVDSEPEDSEETEADEEEPEEEPEEETSDDSEAEVTESDIGSLTNVSGNVEVNETQESGPFSVTVLQARTGQLQAAEQYVEMFGGEDMAMVSLEVEVTNNSEDTNTIYPAQSVIVTNTGNQVDSDIWFSDDVGGEFHGEVTKTGAVHFFFDGNAEDIENVRYIINSGHDENFENLGEDIEFSIDF